MIPVSMLTSDPAMGKLAEELAGKRICRFCLSDGENLVDLGAEKSESKDCWKVKLATCLSISSVNSESLPKFICDLCRKFVNKCYEFRQLCKKTELLLMSYPLTGTWPERLELPSFLRAAKKRMLKTSDTESTPSKQVREGEPTTSHPNSGCIVENPECRVPHKNSSFQCDLQSNYGTIRIEADLAQSHVGSIRVRSRESLTTHATLQSPTITSEVGQQTSSPVMYDLIPKQTVDSSAALSQSVVRSEHVPQNIGPTRIGQTTIQRSSPYQNVKPMSPYPQQASNSLVTNRTEIQPRPSPQRVDTSYDANKSTFPCLRQMISSIGAPAPQNQPDKPFAAQPYSQQSTMVLPLQSSQSVQRVDNTYAVKQPTMQPQQTQKVNNSYATQTYVQQNTVNNGTPYNSSQSVQRLYAVTQPVQQYQQQPMNANVQAPVQQQQINMYAVTQQVKPYPQQSPYPVNSYPHQHINTTVVSQASPLQQVVNTYAIVPNTFNQPTSSPSQAHDLSGVRLPYQQYPPSYQQPAQNSAFQPAMVATTEVPNPQQSPQQQQQQKSDSPAVRCTSCTFRFVDPSHLLLHARQHIGRANFTCGCGEKFYRLSNFVAHLQHRHLTQQQNLSWCFLCRKVFGPDCQPWQHLNQHVAAKLSQACDFCSLIFVNRAERIAHVGKVHEVEVRQVMQLNGIERY